MTFLTQKMLPNRSKDVLLLLAMSNVIYEFVSCCENSYIRRTTQRQGIRIMQHIAKYAMDLFYSRVLPMHKHVIMCSQRKELDSSSSAILKYLLENDSCTQRYASDCFTVIGRAETICKRSVNDLERCVKEALLKHRHKPTLNIQKEA